MSIETANAILGAGNITVNITTGGSKATTQLLDISTIKYDFDLTQSSDLVNAVQVRLGAVTLELTDDLSNGTSAYDAIKQQIGIPTATGYNTVNVNVNYIPLGTTTNLVFAYVLEFADVSYDDKKDTTSLRLRPVYFQNTAIDAAFKTGTNVVYERNYQPVGSPIQYFYNATVAGDYINNYITSLNPFSTTNILEPARQRVNTSRYVYETKDATSYFGADTLLVVERRAFTNQYTQFEAKSAGDVVAGLAAAEGAFFGSAFGVNFYINRLTKTCIVTLDANNITDISFSEFPTTYQNISIGFLSRQTVDSILAAPYWEYTNGATANITNARSYNPRGTQNFALNVTKMSPFVRGGNVIDGNYVSNSNQFGPEVYNPDREIDVARAGQNAYAHSTLAASFTKSMLKIQTEVLGVDKVKPHQVISFDSTVPARFRNINFRPTSLEYDFKADKVKVTAYQID